MFNAQANTARFIYTISTTIPETDDDSAVNDLEKCREHTQFKTYAKLNNGFYFKKVARSDEKVRYTETDIHSIVRTVLFMHVFECEPDNSLLDIINSGDVSYKLDPDFRQRNQLTLQDVKELLDQLFGENFAMVVRRVVSKCMLEYNNIWKYYPFVSNLRLPSAQDIVKLARFVNASMSVFSGTTLFLLENSTDNRIPLQGNIKYLFNLQQQQR